MKKAYLYNNSYSLVQVYLYGIKEKMINGKKIQYKDSVNIYPNHSYDLGEITKEEIAYYKQYSRILVELRFKDEPDKVEEVVKVAESKVEDSKEEQEPIKKVKKYTKSQLLKTTISKLITIARDLGLVVSETSPKPYIINQILDYQKENK